MSLRSDSAMSTMSGLVPVSESTAPTRYRQYQYGTEERGAQDSRESLGMAGFFVSLPTDLGTLGARLRYVREEVIKLGTHKLAAVLKEEGEEDNSNAAVTRYEQDVRVPKLPYLMTISRLSGVPLDWLVLNRQGADGAYVVGRMQKLLDELATPPAPLTAMERAALEAGVKYARQQQEKDREDARAPKKRRA